MYLVLCVAMKSSHCELCFFDLCNFTYFKCRCRFLTFTTKTVAYESIFLALCWWINVGISITYQQNNIGRLVGVYIIPTCWLPFVWSKDEITDLFKTCLIWLEEQTPTCLKLHVTSELLMHIYLPTKHTFLHAIIIAGANVLPSINSVHISRYMFLSGAIG